MKLYKLIEGRISAENADVTFEQSYDVIVAGLGTAGSIACISAARHGLKVLGVERLCAMGGTGTLGAIEPYYFGNKGGLFEEIDAKAFQMADRCERDKSTRCPRMDIKAYVMERDAVSNGAKLCYESEIVGVYAYDSHVCGLLIYSDGEYHSVGSKYVIDATANASVCAIITDKLHSGRAYDGKLQPYTNVSVRKAGTSVCAQNKDAGHVNPTDPNAVTQAFLTAVLQPNCYLEDYSATEGIISNSALLGCREGPKIMSEEDISAEAFVSGKHTDKPLFYTRSNLDNHSKDLMLEDKFLREWYAVCGLWGVCVSLGIPIGTLIPHGIGGLAVCGRAIGAEHTMASGVRMKRDVQKCGEALATAIAIAINDNVELGEVNYDKLSAELRQTGCLDENNNLPFSHRMKDGTCKPFEWATDEAEIKALLASDKPGTAIWSCAHICDSIADTLAEWLNDENEALRKHSALALGLIGDIRACAVLREIVAEADMYIPKTSLKYVQARSVSAVYLLGELGDTASIELMADILAKNGAIFDTADFKRDELYAFEGDLRFELVSFAIRALCEIAKKHTEQKAKIAKIFEEYVFADSFEAKISLKENTDMVYDFCDELRGYIHQSGVM